MNNTHRVWFVYNVHASEWADIMDHEGAVDWYQLGIYFEEVISRVGSKSCTKLGKGLLAGFRTNR